MVGEQLEFHIMLKEIVEDLIFTIHDLEDNHTYTIDTVIKDLQQERKEINDYTNFYNFF
jgi:hypothetical protein